MRQISFINLESQYYQNKASIDKAIENVLRHGQYIMGSEVYAFEKQLCEYLGVKHAITCANGTDALVLSLRALGVKKGDAVFVPSFTFAATAEAVAFIGATPIFVDIQKNTYNLNAESLQKALTVADKLGLNAVGVIAVDLFGKSADYDVIAHAIKGRDIWIMSDCAQSFGATYKGSVICSCKDCLISTTSFFPAKPLGCYGDGGAIFTNNDHLSDIIRSCRVHGKGTDKYDNVLVGQNSRLDTIQAAVLIEKLKFFPVEIQKRNQIAKRYNESFKSLAQTPIIDIKDKNVWAQYSLCLKEGQNRKKIIETLTKKGITTNIYYPKPLHLQTAYKQFPRAVEGGLKNSEFLAKHVFSLPMHPYLLEEEVNVICEAVQNTLKS
jgi:dTDP-4-amino-4,6-dideoxygalactose transaminase